MADETQRGGSFSPVLAAVMVVLTPIGLGLLWLGTPPLNPAEESYRVNATGLDSPVVISPVDASEIGNVTGFQYGNHEEDFKKIGFEELQENPVKEHLIVVAMGQSRAGILSTCEHEFRHAELEDRGVDGATVQHRRMEKQRFWPHEVRSECWRLVL